MARSADLTTQQASPKGAFSKSRHSYTADISARQASPERQGIGMNERDTVLLMLLCSLVHDRKLESLATVEQADGMIHTAAMLRDRFFALKEKA